MIKLFLEAVVSEWIFALVEKTEIRASCYAVHKAVLNSDTRAESLSYRIGNVSWVYSVGIN